jgi:hypothetical protein
MYSHNRIRAINDQLVYREDFQQCDQDLPSVWRREAIHRCLGRGGRKTMGTSGAVDPGHGQSIGGMGEKWFLLTFMRKKCCVRVKQR